MTQPFANSQFLSDWSVFPKVRAGKGVGAFYKRSLHPHWSHIAVQGAPEQSRFYIVTSSQRQLLLGVFYAPDAGKPMVQRWDFYQCLVKTWQHLCAEYHDASKVLAGDANLPGLRFSSRGHIEASNALEEFWCQSFLSNMVCANAFHDCPAPTHTGGNVLDIVLCSSDLEILACDVLSTQLAGSDHFPVLVEVGWQPPGGQNALTWKPFRDVPQQVFDHALQQPFAVLYTWLASALQHKQLHSDLIDLLEDATVLFGVLILGTLWQLHSPFGRFGKQSNRCSFKVWWTRDCRLALLKARESRGTSMHRQMKARLKRVIAKAKCSHWIKFVGTCEKKCSHAIMLHPEMHKFVKDNVRPKLRPSLMVKVDGEFLPRPLAKKVWVRYLQQQVSWEGPCSPSDALKEVRCQNPSLPSTSPFDDDAAAESAKEVRTWQKQFGAIRLDELFPFCFSFSELCDAQASMNAGAVTSPYDHCPMQVVVTKSEAGQLCLLGLVNLAFVTGHLPVMWKIVPVIPIRKPGKIAGDIAGHRPISLMAAVFKLLDKMLYRRIWPAIVSATSPWQGGGTIGADAMAWMVSQVLHHRRETCAHDLTLAAFVDGQSAFCRPPACVVTEALLKIPGVGDYNIRAINAVLSDLHGTALLDSKLTGLWRSETGLPQGGSLSAALFVALLVQLHDALADKDCGLDMLLPDGTSMRMILLAYIDDIVLLADSEAKLQKSLAILEKWARKIRMYINVAPDKTAVMVISGKLTSNLKLLVFGNLVPKVQTYKYMGVTFSSNGSWTPLVDAVKQKCHARTMELMRWGRANNLTCDVLARLWRIYVEHGAVWGVAVALLSMPQTKVLDRTQRVAGRRLLGFSKVSPVPAVCLELGWPLLSTKYEELQLRLLGRLRHMDNAIVAALLAAGHSHENSWTHHVVGRFSAFTLAGLPPSHSSWFAYVRAWSSQSYEEDAVELWSQCRSHPALAHYGLPEGYPTNGLKMNAAIHHVQLPSHVSRAISRLLCGGQGLRGGDPVVPPQASCRNACLYCLTRGNKVVESLRHFLTECPLYEFDRYGSGARKCWKHGILVAHLHLSIWDDEHQKIIRGALIRMLNRRLKFQRAMGDSASEVALRLW